MRLEANPMTVAWALIKRLPTFRNERRGAHRLILHPSSANQHLRYLTLHTPTQDALSRCPLSLSLPLSALPPSALPQVRGSGETVVQVWVTRQKFESAWCHVHVRTEQHSVCMMWRNGPYYHVTSSSNRALSESGTGRYIWWVRNVNIVFIIVVGVRFAVSDRFTVVIDRCFVAGVANMELPLARMLRETVLTPQ